MSTKRRQELQTNELAGMLEKQADFLKPYALIIVAVLVAIPVAILIYYFYQQSSTANKESAWDMYFLAQAAPTESRFDKLNEVADTLGDSPAALWALNDAATFKMNEGMSKLFAADGDREEAQKSLDQARQLYERLDNESKAYPLLQQPTLLSLAQVYEGLGQLDKSVETYKRLAEGAPESPSGKVAQRRLNQMVDQETGEVRDTLKLFYAEYEAYDPKKWGDSRVAALPETPDLSIPEISEEAPVVPAPGGGGDFIPGGITPPTNTPEPKPEDKPEPKPEDKPEPMPEDKPEPKPEDKPEPKPEDKPEPKPEDKPEPKPEDKPEPKPEDKPEPKPEDKPEPKPEDKPEPKPEDKPEPKPEDKPEPKPEDKPEPKPEDKPEPKPEDKPEPKPEDKPEPKPEDKPEPKPEDKPEPKPEDKPEPKSEDKPEPKREDKPKPKAEDPPEPEAGDKPEAETADE